MWPFNADWKERRHIHRTEHLATT
ncbi:MAG: hypothetical protein QOI25_961, partial [Mycobacterium sp.]|nr:hypothetical protein [Mycobacterium sp.]